MPRSSLPTIVAFRAVDPSPSPADSVDEACFLAALRRSVEGAPTPAEDRLARGVPDWDARFGRLCARFSG